MCLPQKILKLFTLVKMRSNQLEYTVENKELDDKETEFTHTVNIKKFWIEDTK